MLKTVWIYGIHSTMEALSNKNRVVYEARCTSVGLKNKIKEIRPDLQSVNIVDEHSLLKLTRGVHQGVAICCEPIKIHKKLEPGLLESIDKILVLDHLQDVSNIGSIMRSMVAIGFPALVVAQTGAPNIENAAIKSSSGALEHITIFQIPNIRDGVKKLKENDFFCIGMDQEGRSFSKLEDQKIALIIGSEGKGIQNIVKKECDTLCCLNTNQDFGVLNAAVAAAIGMYVISN